MLGIILDVFLIIAAICWIILCGFIFVSIRSFNRDQQRQRENDAVATGIAAKAARGVGR